MWHPSRLTRLALGIGGILAILLGLAAWSFETEYGGNGVAGSESSNGVTRVFDADEGSVDSEGHPITTIVFEGSEAEAVAFMERRWNEGRNYTIPVLMLVAGGVMMLGAVTPSFGRRSTLDGERAD